MTNDKLIQVKDLKKYYKGDRIKALDGVTVDINRGDVMVVIGPSGSGKSTFLRSLNLLEVPTSGSIVFENVDITKKTGPDGKKLSDSEIASRLKDLFDLRPAAIIRKFGLKNPIYSPTASYGHFGREPYTAMVKVVREGRETEIPARFFAWEDCDSIPAIKKEFKLK